MSPKNNITALHISILQELFYLENATCNQLTLRVQKSLPLVAKAINDLENWNFIKDTGLAPSSGGRRPLNYSLVNNRFYFILVSSDQFSTQIGIYDWGMNLVHPINRITLEIQQSDALFKIVNTIKEYIHDAGIESNLIMGIGFGMPGFIQATEGINHTYLTPPTNFYLREYLSQEIGLPVFIENDSRLIALSELKFNKELNQEHSLVINLGWGIGLGILINDSLFTGSDGFAGEFSHIPLSDDKILCTCGKQGCLEAVASLTAIVKKAIKEIDKGRSTRLQALKKLDNRNDMVDLIFNEALAGDQFAIELIADAAYSIGKGLAILIHILNPKEIVLSGKSSPILNFMMAPMQQALHRFCIPKLFSNIEIKASTLGPDAVFKGAAILVMQQLNKEKLNSFLN
ncbi:MAG: ROK family protein [Pedobacter sp.]|nr:MAG: ROK family protein [Pedobacter sp.]